MVSLRPCPGIPGRSRLPAFSWVLCVSHNAACLCWPARCNLLCVYLSARCGAAAGASRCIPWACACCSERSAHHERGLSHRSAPRSVYLHLPAVSLPARCALPLVALCVALCAFLLCRGLLPPSGTGAVWCAWCCCLLGFCRIGEFFSHTREQRGLREKPRKFLRAGDMLAYGLRLCVCVRLPALPPAPPCGRSFPPGYAPSVGGFFRASARFCLSCLAIAWATLPAISCATLPPARDCLPLCVSYPGCLWSARLLWCFLYPLSISYT